MEPLSPAAKRRILQTRPQASRADVEEYERPLAERFAENPECTKSATAAQAAVGREKRLRELHTKLFG
jgi:hypothetical protein